MKTFVLLVAAGLVAIAAAVAGLWLAVSDRRAGCREPRRLPPATRGGDVRTLLRLLLIGDRGCF